MLCIITDIIRNILYCICFEILFIYFLCWNCLDSCVYYAIDCHFTFLSRATTSGIYSSQYSELTRTLYILTLFKFEYFVISD